MYHLYEIHEEKEKPKFIAWKILQNGKYYMYSMMAVSLFYVNSVDFYDKPTKKLKIFTENL